jgi:hypothetical protein
LTNNQRLRQPYVSARWDEMVHHLLHFDLLRDAGHRELLALGVRVGNELDVTTRLALALRHQREHFPRALPVQVKLGLRFQLPLALLLVFLLAIAATGKRVRRPRHAADRKRRWSKRPHTPVAVDGVAVRVVAVLVRADT